MHSLVNEKLRKNLRKDNFFLYVHLYRFLGCGRKRSDASYADQPPMADRMAMEQLTDMGPSSPGDKLGDLIDLNSEPAVEDLMRQIMSQAKLWEAIQEANRDLDKNNKGVSISFSAQ